MTYNCIEITQLKPLKVQEKRAEEVFGEPLSITIERQTYDTA